MEIHPSARKHGVSDEDITHVYGHIVGWLELADEPRRYLVAGPDRAGNLLELVILVTPKVELVIHAMKLRPSNEAPLFGGDPR